MNQTPKHVIVIVVATIAGLAVIGVSSLCLSLFRHTYADPAILTALISITSGLVGSLTTILVSPRSTPPATDTTSTTTSTTKPDASVPAIPTPVIVANKPTQPVPVTEPPKT